jgi:hypothetical protein
MTIEALSLTICLASGIFGRPAWSPEKCTERAEQILSIATSHKIDPLLMVAVQIQECDMRENVDAPIYKGEGKKRKIVGRDACPMGVRLMGAIKPLPPEDLYEMAAKRMERWKDWCGKGHPGTKFVNKGDKHHFIFHYNQGNPIYAAQVLSFLSAITRRPAKKEYEEAQTARTKEIVKRLARAFRQPQS